MANSVDFDQTAPMLTNGSDVMANSVDFDQTAPVFTNGSDAMANSLNSDLCYCVYKWKWCYGKQLKL